MTKATLVIENDDGTSYKADLPLTLVQAAPNPTPIPVPTEPAPAPVSTITKAPLSWNSPLFAKTASSGALRIPSGSLLQDKTITVDGPAASVEMGSNSTMRRCRIRSAEGVRIGSNTYTIEDSWIEAKATSKEDHADGIQAYAGPSGGGPLKLFIRRTTIRAYDDYATAGLFVADKIHGEVTLEDVIFWGGPFGLALYSDVLSLTANLKNVIFVGPFMWNPFGFRDDGGGNSVIGQWENVFHGAMKDGVLTKGAAIPRPF